MVVNGGQVGALILTPQCQDFAIDIPRAAMHGGLLHIVFQVSAPVSPKSLGRSADPRRLGIALRSFAVHVVGAPGTSAVHTLTE